MDFLVVAAISTINVEVVLGGLVPLAILVVAGVLWNVFCVMWLARRLLPADSWFERSIAEMGQSMGVTATGLLLLRVVDPEGATDATSAFGYKQLMHEPFMGGGLWTSAAIPLALAYHPVWVLGISAGAVALSDAKRSITVILYLHNSELLRTRRILRELELEGADNIVLIDARKDNKPSGSKAA